jgi:hypothetical protein
MLAFLLISLVAGETTPSTDHHDYLEGYGSFAFPNFETKWSLTNTHFETKVITSGSDKV